MLDRYDQELLLDYLEGDLDPAQRAQLDTMLDQDPQLAALLSAMVGDRDALRSLPRAQAPTELLHDVTQSLERRMLLDENALPETGPIPIARGRDLPGEPTGGPRWGRIAGLSALAASVALAAGIVVITMNNDPLENVADRLGSTNQTPAPPTDAEPVRELASGDNALPEPAAPISNVPGIETPAASARPSDGGFALGDPGLEDHLPDRIALDPGSAVTDPNWLGHSRGSVGQIARSADAAHETRRLNDAAQPAIALAVTEPRQQLVLFTEEPALTQEQLVAFCVANGIPIVRTNLDMNGWTDTKQFGQLSQLQAEGNKPADLVAPDDFEPKQVQADAVGNYALLIDEEKLGELVQDFNGRNTLDKQGADRQRRLVSNQAAYVADLEPGKARVAQQAARVAPLNAAANIDGLGDNKVAESKDASANLNQLAQQQTIELRLPGDLGSPYANSLNKSNLGIMEQRRGYTQAFARADSPVSGEPKADLARHAEKLLTQREAEREKLDLDPNAGVAHDDDAAAGVNAAPAENTPDLERHLSESGDERDAPLLDTQDQGPEQGQARRERSDKFQYSGIDPKRGNWLTPHLPLAETTPLLQWRTFETQRSPQLVPIFIQQAPTEQVNSLRLQVQIEQLQRYTDANRKDQQAGKPVLDQTSDDATDSVEDAPAETPAEPGNNP